MLVGRAAEGIAQVELQALRDRSAATLRRFQALRRFLTPRTVLMHIGAGDCVLALQAATYVERVYAIDPSDSVLARRRLPVNLRAVFSGPGGFGVQAETVHVAYSETFQPARLKDIARCLARGGVYVFQPQRAHSARQLRRELLAAGFSEVRFPAFYAIFPRKELVAAIR